MANEIRVVLQQILLTTSEATMRQHKVLVDRSAAKGGTDLGPMGGELFLSAVGGCFMSNLLAAFRHEIIARRGIHGREQARPRISPR
jgi:putative redox protein